MAAGVINVVAVAAVVSVVVVVAVVGVVCVVSVVAVVSVVCVVAVVAEVCVVSVVCVVAVTGKNNGFPFLDILGYLKNTHKKNPKFGKVRQVPIWEFPPKFPDWDLSHSSKFWIFMGIL